jgi:hypothetical protein
MNTVEPSLLDEIQIKHRQVGHRLDPRGIIGTAEPRMLGNQDFVVIGERVEERQPLRDATSTMQEE